MIGNQMPLRSPSKPAKALSAGDACLGFWAARLDSLGERLGSGAVTVLALQPESLYTGF